MRSSASQAVGKTVLSMTLVQSRLLILQIVAFLSATTGITMWYEKYFQEFYNKYPTLSVVVVLIAPLYILCFSVGPQLWRRRQEVRRNAITLIRNPEAAHTNYYHLGPYVAATPDEFIREDDAHNDVLRWIRSTKLPALFLSGVSGAGKSSVLEGYVVPTLKREGWRIEEVRNFTDALSQLESIVTRRKPRGTRLLIVFDQFEEFVILEERASSQERRNFIARARELCQISPPGLCLLFAFRRDYMSDVIGMHIAECVPGSSFVEIDAFRRDAARRFFERAPEAPSSVLVDRLLAGAEALDDVPARFRPVTLNMLGLALQDFDQQVTGRPERLVQGYMQTAIAQPEIREIAPVVIERMITDANTSQPRTVPELAAETRLLDQDVVACLVLLARKGLVRQLNATQNLWVISHDFVARQFALLLGRLRPSRWPMVTMFSAALLFVGVMSAIIIGIPLYIRDQAYAELRGMGVGVVEKGSHTLYVSTITNDDTLTHALAYLRTLGEELILDFSFSGVTALPSLKGFTMLRELNLTGTDVTSLPPLDDLTGLETLNLHLSGVRTLPSLSGLKSLKTLDLSESKVRTLPSLQGLSALQTLDLNGCTNLTQLPPLQDLESLETLDIRGTGITSLPVSLTTLPKLQKLHIGNGNRFTMDPVVRELGLKVDYDIH
jgi:hypothetical protein